MSVEGLVKKMSFKFKSFLKRFIAFTSQWSNSMLMWCDRQLWRAVKSQLAIQRRGWYSLMVTWPSTSHHTLRLQCKCICVLLVWCLLSRPILVARLIVYRLSIQQQNNTNYLTCHMSQATYRHYRWLTVNSCIATQTMLCPSVIETVSIRETNLRNTTECGQCAWSEPVTSSVAGKCVSYSATLHRQMLLASERIRNLWTTFSVGNACNIYLQCERPRNFGAVATIVYKRHGRGL